MKRAKTYSEQITLEVDGLLVRGWKKKCPICGKTYETTSRGQKFCSNECCKKSQVKRRKQQKEYNATKEVVRLSARSHSVGVEVVRQLIAMGLMENKCSCGCTENLQVHHVNGCWLDNTPSNLILVCPKCHADIHSKLEAEFKAQGKTLEDYYNVSFKPILAVLNKNINESTED